jgi:hypothetical protein
VDDRNWVMTETISPSLDDLEGAFARNCTCAQTVMYKLVILAERMMICRYPGNSKRLLPRGLIPSGSISIHVLMRKLSEAMAAMCVTINSEVSAHGIFVRLITI